MIFEQQIKTWIEQNKLKKESPHADQIRTLIEKSEKDINVAKLTLDIDLETAYGLCYSSMLKAGRALMLSKGYRTAVAEQHKITVEFCEYFIDKGSNSLVKAFDSMRRNRNTLAYDPWYSNDIGKGDVLSAIKTAETFLVYIKNLFTF